MRPTALFPTLLALSLMLVTAACGVEEAVPVSTVTPPPSLVAPDGPLFDAQLEAMLIPVPSFGGPWTMEADEGRPIDVLEPVCGVGYPDERPFSQAHAGRLFIGGSPYPILLQAVDRFAGDEAAAAIVDMHRQAALACTSWTRPLADGTAVDFTIRALDITLPADAIAFEVTAAGADGPVVTRQALFRSGSHVVFVAHVAVGDSDPAFLGL
ncbi:MAG: hypothetical protein MUP76_01905, partial [Acidimicrobiia bacterium]|nr:hypothetical protein [Acidimicrobiia bacterium]